MTVFPIRFQLINIFGKIWQVEILILFINLYFEYFNTMSLL